MRIVIIGNGIAGVNAAAAVRALCPEAEALILAEDTRPLYSRVRLPEVLSGAAKPEDITFYKDEWYAKKGIEVRLSSRVESIDRASREVLLADGSRVRYDALILATGALANKPPIPGSEAAGVFTMRSMEDTLAIRESLLANPDSASVIGGGLLGLEAARAIKDSGVREVRVFEIFNRLLPRQLDETGAALLAARFSDMGIEIVCGAETESFIPDAQDPSRAFAIRLKDGRVFKSSTTVLSMGVKPNAELARKASLPVARGVVVDELMRAGDERVFACGDCAEFSGIVWGIIPAALEQAPVAARSALAALSLLPAGEERVYAQTVPKTALKIAGVELMSLGKAVLTAEEERSGRWVSRSRVWEGGARYEKFVMDTRAPEARAAANGSGVDVGKAADGGPSDVPVLAGAILYGSKAHQSAVQAMMGKPVTDAELDALLSD